MQRAPTPARAAQPAQLAQPAQTAAPGASSQLELLGLRRQELRNQLSSLTERRVLLSVQARDAEGAAKRELEGRIRALDERTARIDQQLNEIDDATSAALEGGGAALAGGRGGGNRDLIQQPRTPAPGVIVVPPAGREQSAFIIRKGIANVMAFQGVTFLLLALLMWRWTRRRGAGVSRLAPEDASRIDQLQRAVDVIAVEVERISEGQRFVSKLLSEKPSAIGVGDSSANRR